MSSPIIPLAPTAAPNKEVKQPIHPSMLPLLDPQYVAFHNTHLAHLTPPHTIPWDAKKIRQGPAVPGGSEPLLVGEVKDFEIPESKGTPKLKVRTYTPKGEKPEGGWDVFIFFHGGGWTLGDIASEAAFCTNMCIRANCVVVSVDYRLGPENPYPAAVEDAVDALQWVYHHGEEALSINKERIIVGGSSSGGNLAAILAIKSKSLSPTPIPINFQLLVVPVTDNTASVSTRSGWAKNQYTPWLSPARMEWFKSKYLPNEEDWTKWDASPWFATKELLQPGIQPGKNQPGAWIGVCELDILCEEGVEFGEKLRDAGWKVEVEIYKGAPHPIMAMDAVLDIGRKLVSDAAAALKKAFESL